MLTQIDGEYFIRYDRALVPLSWAAKYRSHWLHTVAACMCGKASDVAIINTFLGVAGPEYQLHTLTGEALYREMDLAIPR